MPVIGFGFRHSDFEFTDWLDLVGFTWMPLQYQLLVKGWSEGADCLDHIFSAWPSVK